MGGGTSNNLYPQNIQNMSLNPPDYDPRRLFPFGLSPIPEVPSELASEVSSIASSPTPSYDDSDTEIESVRSRGSIMYSGSCDSIKSNVTIHGKTSDESSTESEDEVTATEEDETEDEQDFRVETLPVDPSSTLSPVIKISEHEVKISHPTQEKTVETNKDTLYQSEVTQVTQVSHSTGSVREVDQPDIDGDRIGGAGERPEIILDMGSGAATASEIFRHLQATRGKQEVTTELAKILTVLKTTLQNDKDSSSSDDEATSNQTSQTKNPMPTGKPPRPPFKPKAKSLASISPVIQAKIKELEQSKSNNPKEEMNLLSKILVHLLCSCKTAAAAQELKAVIKQFKEVAKVAMEEGDDSLEALKICSRPNSRTSVRRKARSRTASGNSNISGNSETDSLNTLTPGDSKSSGTDDETAGDSNLNKLRFTSNVVKKEDIESCVSYTLTLPLAKQQDLVGDDGDNYDEGDEEWEWEYEDELDASTPTKQGSSGSSRNLTPSEGKSDVSSGSTRKLLTEMELGAYNCSSTSQSDHGNSQSTPITEEEEEDYSEDENRTRRRQTSGPEEVSGHLFCHLEETFKVLSDTYKIITTGDNSPECENYPSYDGHQGHALVRQQARHGDSDDGFEGILDGISNQCVQIETEILRNSRQSTPASPGPGKVSRPSSRVSSRSRPGSRQNTKTPSSGQDEEDWGDEDQWEYYYEEDYPEEGPENEIKTSRPSSRQRPPSRPASRPASRQNLPQSRPGSRQKEMEQVRVVSRPASAARVASRPASRAKESAGNANDDWNYEEWGDPSEWEYYYEDEADETGVVSSRPVSRAASRVASRAPSRQGPEPFTQVPSRAASRQESLGLPPSRTSSRQESLVQPPSRTASRQESLVLPPSRTASRQESLVQPPSRTASRQDALVQPPSRTASRQDALRPTSRQELLRPSSRQEPIRVSSRQEVPRAAEIVAEIKELGERVPSRIRVVSRPASRAKEEEDWEWDTGEGEWEGYEGEWEYYYEESEPAPPPAVNTAAKVAPAIVINKDSRPNSRQTQSRPTSRPTSRTGSRAASRLLRNQSALGSVYEEDDQWYEDDDELARLSPTLTTAPTTRATSPFPNEREAVEYNTGSGFSGRRCSVIVESEESTPRPSTVLCKTPTNMESVTPRQSRPVSKQSNPESVGYLKRTAVASVALAAEYLGQDAVMLAASLPPEFIEENIVKEKKKKKQRRKESDSQEDYEGEDDKKKRKKKKKDKDGKFLPKVGVKELANRLEGELFKDNVVGAKMVISKDEARDVIRETRKKMKSVNSCLQESSKASTPARHSPPDKEDKRKSVKEMVEILSTQQLQEQAARAAGGPPPPVPPPPQNYYSSPSPQYPPNYQPYPVEVRAQYPHYQQDNPYQQYPPQHPYQQYQQQYHAYQGYPPPPPHYQQYPPQQYQQYQQYPPPQGYAPPPQQYQYQPQPPPPPQPMIYQGDSASQMKVVSGGQTTMVNMRNKNSGARQKEAREQQRSPDDSEAYGTGSTGSDQTENQVAGIDHDEGVEQEGGGGAKPHKRHSRLFKLLQDSDYTDSDTDSRADFSSRISMKNVEDNHGKESDRDSICSGLERKAVGLDRKHSFRSHKSSNKESDNESVTSSGVERKLSPNSMQKSVTTRRLMQLSLNTEYEPSSSELSTPNSPTTVGPADRKKSNSKPPARVWNYHADDFDSHAGTSDDSSYQSLQSLNSFDSIYESNAGREVEEIMKRKVQPRDGLYRYSTDSPHNYVTASPKTVEILRNSPKIHSGSPKFDAYQRASPKIEQELMELTNFPSSPGLTLRQLQSHRNFYTGSGGGLGK